MTKKVTKTPVVSRKRVMIRPTPRRRSRTKTPAVTPPTVVVGAVEDPVVALATEKQLRAKAVERLAVAVEKLHQVQSLVAEILVLCAPVQD